MKSFLWHGYPQKGEAHTDRPWWVKHEKSLAGALAPVGVKGWLHPSGAFAFGDDAEEVMAQYDVENPLPPPPPKCNQVWVKNGSSEKSITRVEKVEGGEERVYIWTGADRYSGEWPPEGYVLAHGPLSPWAPTGEEE